MGFFNELAKLFKGKPPERHGAHGVTKEIKVAKRLEEIQDKERIKEIERDRERAKERRYEKEKREFEQSRTAILAAGESLRRPRVRQEFEEKVINEGERRNKKAAYLASYFERPGTLQALNSLIEAHDGVADAVHELSTGDESVHGDPQSLLRLGAGLRYEAARAENQGITDANEAIEPLMQAIVERSSRYLLQAKDQLKEIYARQGKNFHETAWLAQLLNITPQEAERILQDPEFEEQMKNKVKELLTQIAAEQPIEPLQGEDESWIEAGKKPRAEDVTPPIEFIDKVNEIWRKAESREGRKKLGIRELDAIKDELEELEHKSYPTAVGADTRAFDEAVRKLHGEIEDKLKTLAKRAIQRLEEEGPELSYGKMTQEEFLGKVGEPGHFGYLTRDLEQPENKELLDLFVGFSEESHRFRDQVFLRLHRGVLTFTRDSSQDTFGLYQRGDFDTFISFIGNHMPYRQDKRSGNSVAEAITKHYSNLSNAIRLSRDMDYNASQPGANFETLSRISALYQNEYVIEALSIPAVEQAFRCLEDTLTGIKDAQDGYIPPQLVEYDAVKGTVYVDDRAKQMLRQMAENKQVFDVKRDKNNSYLHIVEKDGRTIVLDRDNPEKMRDLIHEDKTGLHLSMYMTLAKGFHMGTARWLEMIANSKCPGSDNTVNGMPGFHSMAGYEGVASALNFASFVIEKFKFGGHKYIHIMNMMLPKDEKLPADPINAREAIELYLAYRDGTLKEKYPKAKRLIDLSNFSKISSALGSQTLWRYLDASIGWTDKEKELLGGPVRILLSENYAKEKVKDLLVNNKFKMLYRGRIQEENRKLRDEGRLDEMMPDTGPRFEALWKSQGEEQYKSEIANMLYALDGKTPDGKVLHHSHKNEVYKEWIKKYQLAYNARVWVETVMRNPIVVAHNVNVDTPVAGFEGKSKKTTLHSQIMHKILGVPPEDFQYGTVVEEKNGNLILRQSAGKFASPTSEQRRYLNELLDLEGDVASAREIAVREQRDLREEDFDEAIHGEKEGVRRKRAKKYWEMCRQACLGSTDLGRAQDLYNQFGISFNESLVGDYKIDWEKIYNIENILKEEGRNSLVLNEEFLLQDWDWIFGTNDLALRQMDLINLGSRSWFRRIGVDIMGHYKGAPLIGQYLDQLTPQPDDEELQKTLRGIVSTYAEDDVTRGWEVAGLLSFATDKIYAWDAKHLGSYAQREIWKEMMGVDAWGPNRRYKWWHGIKNKDILPPHGHDFYQTPHHFNVHALEKASHTQAKNMILEIIFMGMLVAIVMTSYKAFITKDKEDEEGGGGNPH